MRSNDAQQLLRHLFDSAVRASSATTCLPATLQALQLAPPAGGRTVVIGAGKAAAAMAAALEQHWPAPLSGLVVTRYGHAMPCTQIEVVEAAHPVPDAAGRDAARRMLDMVHGLTANDLVLCLISGGGSALLTLPAEGVTLEQKQAINKALLRSGATIGEINCVRKHLSAIKGGRLALACAPAQVVTLLISDVPGDDPATIASGPTVADPTSCTDALAVLDKYAVALEPSLRQQLESGTLETPKPGDPRLSQTACHLIATPQQALEAAAATARAAGVTPYILSDSIEGEARDIGSMHAALAIQIARRNQPFAAPCVVLSGGETTVTVRGNGRGGRNAEFLLSLAMALNGQPGVHAIACDTDGIDGSEDNAGALIAPDTLARADRLGLHTPRMLNNNDAYGFFQRLGDLVVTGPTLTNVNDFRAILIL